jgi:hypothetical protein
VSPARLLRLLWLTAGLGLVLGWWREVVPDWPAPPRALPRADGRSGVPWLAGPFLPDGRLQWGDLPAHLETASSHVGGDAFTGRAESAWFRANRSTIRVGVAGYPGRPGCGVRLEFRDTAGAITAVPYRGPAPAETWQVWEVSRPRDAVAVRVVGEDDSAAHQGWVAFSHPFRSWPLAASAAWAAVRVFTTLALVLVLLWGPGLLAAPAGASAGVRACWFLGTGPLGLAASGVLLWATAPWLPVGARGLLAAGLLGALWWVVGARARRLGWQIPGESGWRHAVVAAALAVAAVATKASYSTGTAGELFRGTVSRNFALSDRIDSRFSFYAVQAAAHGWAPTAERTERFYYPWTYFSRGPWPGLVAVPLVLGTGGRPPTEHAEETWSPFDAGGFATYRIVQYALAAAVIPAAYLLLLPLAGAGWALAGAGLLALTPFGLHEILFTWPKWAATAWLAAAFTLVHARQPAAAGFAVGLGFLHHPLVLLWTPWLAVWCAGRHGPGLRAIAAGVTRLTVASALVVLPWMLAGRLLPHLPETPFAGQGGFIRYFLLADAQHATLETWLRTRWMNFANTFVPLHLLLDPASAGHFRLSSAYEPSSALTRLTFLWWNTLPFALGLSLWGLTLAALTRAWRTHRAALGLFAAAPALLLIVYWGWEPLGLMRECGHPLLLALVVLAILVAAGERPGPAAWLAHPATPWLQVPGTLVMCWLPVLANPSPPAVRLAHLDGLHLTLHLAALGTLAWMLARARRDPTLNPTLCPRPCS